MPPNPLRVLVVDDYPDCRAILGVLLRLWGHDVREAGDGPAALREAASWRPDVVLLDVAMPGMDGLELARRLRRLAGLERALLVALTGYAADAARCLTAGIDRHLPKPADPDEVRSMLDAAWRAGGP